MNNKKKLFIGVAALGVLGMVGAGIGILNQGLRVNETKAADSDYTLYLKPNSNWLESTPRFAAYFFKDGLPSQWENMTVDALGYYSVVTPSTYRVDGAKVIFARMNGSILDNSFGKGDGKPLWNQTGNLNIHYKHAYFVDGWDSSDDSHWSAGEYTGENRDYTYTVYAKGNSGIETGGTVECYVWNKGGSDYPTGAFEAMDGAYNLKFEGGPVFRWSWTINTPLTQADLGFIVRTKYDGDPDANKSADQTISPNKVTYFHTDSNKWYTDLVKVENGTQAEQADLAIDITKAINNATDSSVCKVASGTASTLVGKYDALVVKDNHAVIDAAKINTWKTEAFGGGAETDDIDMGDIIAQLRKIASPAMTTYTISESKLPGIEIAATLGALVITFAGAFFIISKKRKVE